MIVYWFFIDFQIKSDLIAVLLFCNQTSKVIKVKQKAFFYKGPCFLGMRSIIVLNQRFYTRYVCSFKETSFSFLAIKLGLSLIANFHLSSSTSSSSSQFTHVHTYIHSQEITSACTIINIWEKSKTGFFVIMKLLSPEGKNEVFSFIPIVLEDEKEKKIYCFSQTNIWTIFWWWTTFCSETAEQSLCRSIVNKKYQNVFSLFCLRTKCDSRWTRELVDLARRKGKRKQSQT